MPVYLGIDTGGTFTDAVVFDPERGVIASAKSLTTRSDLSIGVAGAVSELVDALSVLGRIDMVSLSTTLATNAIVEGQGSPVCLVLIGQDVDVLSRFGLRQALGQDPVAHIAGGHTYEGVLREPLDEAAIRDAARNCKGRVAAFAVVSHFGVLNPEHELRAAAILREESGLPVTCSHELTSRLNAPRRAVNCILNGRLIPLIDQLIRAVQKMLLAHGVDAPLMVVQADGSVVNAESARIRPVQTILSGPAASVIGAGYLAGCSDALIADIGGTTTDLALLSNGQPKLNVDGAVVGEWRTMVEAVDVATVGLGGDSEIDCDERGRLLVGPQRAVPLSLLATQFPEIIEVLRAQAKTERFEKPFGRFAIRLRALDTDPRHLGKFEQLAWNAVADRPVALDWLLQDRSLRLMSSWILRRGLPGGRAGTACRTGCGTAKPRSLARSSGSGAWSAMRRARRKRAGSLPRRSSNGSRCAPER